ncbi:MAG TPA: hypothetical protein VIB39_11415, partial [Candidatus Angelobacter sp.]
TRVGASSARDKKIEREPDHAASPLPQQHKQTRLERETKAGWSELRSRQKTKKAARQQGSLLFSRENSSNGVSKKTIRTFWRNLIGRRKAVSRNFSRINAFVFNHLISLSTCFGE